MHSPLRCLQVADTSEVFNTMPPERMNDIFRPFSQVQNLGEDLSAITLGLLAVRTKIELLGGNVGVRPNDTRKLQQLIRLTARVSAHF